MGDKPLVPMIASAAPRSPQNFRPVRFSWPHAVQVMLDCLGGY
jgi:hypothetical protein